jgi:ATP-binding cassette subfamily B protein
MGAPAGDVPDERLMYAVRMARLEGLIEKRRDAGGLDASVGAGGASLSAGERQRIALGRIFLRDPQVIVCDEYTANIDNATARLIQEALKTEFAGKTRVVITHQLYTIKGADTIFVLDQGHIVDHGAHPELLARGGLYKDMWEVQRVE